MIHRRIWLRSLIIFLGFTAGIWSCAGSDERLQPSFEPTSVVVWHFDDLRLDQLEASGMGELLAARVSGRLEETGQYTVVEREVLLQVVEELHLSSSELAEDATRLRLGRITGAQQMIFGSIQVIGNVMRLDMRQVEVASGLIINTAVGTAAADDTQAWFEIADQALLDLITAR